LINYSSEKEEKPHFPFMANLEQQHGNYKSYYRKKRIDTDERVNSFSSDWFIGKKCIDIGCNEGDVTMKLAQKLLPNFIIGIDLDPRMIDAASAALKRAKLEAVRATAAYDSSISIDKKDISYTKRNPFLPRSIQLTKKPVPLPSVPSSSSSSSSSSFIVENIVSTVPSSSTSCSTGLFPDNVAFVCKNVIDFISSTAKYDVVTCLSVTKWIHLTEGDSGLIALFQIIYQLTSPGGRAIIEYQPWSSYLNNKKTSPTTLRVFDTLKIRPEDFELLLTRDVGFRIEARLGANLSEAKGFKRPILVLIKAYNDPAICLNPYPSDKATMEVESETDMIVEEESTDVIDSSVKGKCRKRYFGELEPSEAEEMLDEAEVVDLSSQVEPEKTRRRRKK
jgi:7SK snRNA methylphosphate capping enzyme